MPSNLLVAVVISVCVHGASGFLTPTMVQRMLSEGRPPLLPHRDGTVSTQCVADLAEVILARNEELLQVADAIGKPQSGIMVGNLAWLGHYDECMGITGFKYCLSHLKLSQQDAFTGFPGPLHLRWGLCVPESCSNSDILSSLVNLLDLVNAPFKINAVNASSVSCAEDPPAAYGTGFLLTMFLFAVLAMLLLLGAFLDSTLRSINYKTPPTTRQPVSEGPDRPSDVHPYQRATNLREDEDERVRTVTAEERPEEEEERPEEDEEKPTVCTRAWQQFLLHFALTRNLAKLFSTKTSKESISCLNGIRVISMSWVILGHVSTFATGISILGNPLFAMNYITRFGFQAVINAYYSVDSFFFLSGLLVAYMTLGRMAKTNGSIPWFWFYFHRYWRLTPAVGVTMLISIFFKPHLGAGPIWQAQVRDQGCAKYWWTNLLYISNIYPAHAYQCIGWVWYLANDMQFFVISPFILILLYRVPIFGMLTMAVLCIVSVVITAILMVKYKFSAVAMDALNPHHDPNHTFTDEIYVKPYCRIAPYLVGMAMGYFLHLNRGKTFKLNALVMAAGWAIATAIGMALVYGFYFQFHGSTFTTAESAIYMALCKVAWGMCLAWVVFACHFGYGGWINDFLSWDIWIPMSRLTYSAYLLHPIIVAVYSFNLANSYFFSQFTLTYEAAASVVMAYLAAIWMALFIEFPLGNLEKMFMPSSEKKAQ